MEAPSWEEEHREQTEEQQTASAQTSRIPERRQSGLTACRGRLL